MEVLLILGLWMTATGLFVLVEGPHPRCAPDHYYQDLLGLTHTDSCLPAVLVWEKLFHLTPECRHNILPILSAHFGQDLNISSYCQCDQSCSLPHFTIHGGHEQHDHDTCMQNDIEYSHLYNTYVANDANHGHGVCTTHHQVWQHLYNVHYTGESQFCRDHLIKQLFYAYEHHSGYSCTKDGYEHNSGHNFTTVPSAVSVAPTMTTTTSILAITSCNKNATISSVLHRMQFQHPNSSSCSSTNDHLGPEALVFNLCQTTNDTSQWKVGPNVMSNCQKIPLYTPVATFINGAYSNNGGLSGIFLGCLPDGFKLAVQECGSNSKILNLGHGGILIHDPNLYFVVTE